MLNVIARKLMHVLPVLLIVSVVTMFLVELTPGEPAYSILGENATPEQVDIVNEQLGRNDPLLERWWNWVSDAATGDFGTSYRTRQPVTEAIMQRLPVTLEIGVSALLLALLISVPLGVYTAYRADRRADRLVNVVTSVLISSPTFLTGVLLSYLLAVRYQIFPVTGWTPLTKSVSDNLRSAFLPVLALTASEIAVFSRLVRADMIATLQNNFILTASAKGLPNRYILTRHALRPSSFSLLTLSGLSLGRLIGGSVVIEAVFALPGVGSLLVQSILAKDLMMVQGMVFVVAIVYIVVNTGVDFLYAALDPRVRAGGA